MRHCALGSRTAGPVSPGVGLIFQRLSCPSRPGARAAERPLRPLPAAVQGKAWGLVGGVGARGL